MVRIGVVIEVLMVGGNGSDGDCGSDSGGVLVVAIVVFMVGGNGSGGDDGRW